MKKIKVLITTSLFLALSMLGSKMYSTYSPDVFYILTGSMHPFIPSNSFTLTITTDTYHKYDIVVFYNTQNQTLTSHRIIGQVTNTKFITKGDSNTKPDFNLVNKKHILGKVVLVLPGSQVIITTLMFLVFGSLTGLVFRKVWEFAMLYT